MSLAGQRWSVTTAGERDTESWKQITGRVRATGATVEAIVHKRIDVLVASALAVRLKTQRVRRAAKVGVPVVGVEYIEACLARKGGKLPAVADYPPLTLDQKPSRAPLPVAAEAAETAAAEVPALPRAAVFRRLLDFGVFGLAQPRWVRDYQLSLAISHLRGAGRQQKKQRKQRKGGVAKRSRVKPAAR
jgi:hypothetical protein